MTEYGRGRAPEPWHPEDPLYGDQGWNGHPAQQGPMPYAGGPQEQYAQAPQHQDPQQYQEHQQYQDPQQQYPQQYPQQGYDPQQQHPQQQHQPEPQPAYGGQVWDTGQAQYVGAPAPVDPYAGMDPYAQQTGAAYPGEAPDLYGTPEAFPPPVPPSRRHLEPEPQEDDLLAEEPAEELSSQAGDDAGRAGGGGRRSGRSKKNDKPKRRSVSCLVAAVVVTAVLGGGGYYGYTFIKERYGPGEDFAGSGMEEVIDVEIPKGATLGQMGSILQKAGVVASAKAFVSAANDTPKGKSIQPGIYPLHKKMSAAAAVGMMTDPSKLNVIIVPEGKRNVDVYDMIDNKLGKKPGTTQDIAKREAKNLGLPAWAGNNPKILDPLEGFMYPARYDLTKDMSPEALLKQMVKNATDKYTQLGIESKAKDLGLENPLQVVTVASLVNAEGKNHDDFRKMSEVVYNRLKKTNDVTNQKLEFDSTYNYVKGTSNINFSLKEARAFDNPYNTHFVKGLPPGPIGNPGADALNATLNPDHGGWMFFVSIDGKTTTFTKTYEEHQKLAAEFQERQKQKNGG